MLPATAVAWTAGAAGAAPAMTPLRACADDDRSWGSSRGGSSVSMLLEDHSSKHAQEETRMHVMQFLVVTATEAAALSGPAFNCAVLPSPSLPTRLEAP